MGGRSVQQIVKAVNAASLIHNSILFKFYVWEILFSLFLYYFFCSPSLYISFLSLCPSLSFFLALSIPRQYVGYIKNAFSCSSSLFSFFLSLFMQNANPPIFHSNKIWTKEKKTKNVEIHWLFHINLLHFWSIKRALWYAIMLMSITAF